MLSEFSRLQAIATPVVSGMEKVQVIPPPKDVSPQILAWKGAAVLGKMESISELWITPEDWVILPAEVCEGLHLNLFAGNSGYARPERAMLLPLRVLVRIDCFEIQNSIIPPRPSKSLLTIE